MYHVNYENEAKICDARKRPCKFQGKDSHFESAADAIKESERRLSVELGDTARLSKSSVKGEPKGSE